MLLAICIYFGDLHISSFLPTWFTTLAGIGLRKPAVLWEGRGQVMTSEMVFTEEEEEDGDPCAVWLVRALVNSAEKAVWESEH